MEEKMHWWYRWSLDKLEMYHWFFFAAIAFLGLAPFLALVSPEAGGLSIIVFGVLLFFAAHMVPD